LSKYCDFRFYFILFSFLWWVFFTKILFLSPPGFFQSPKKGKKSPPPPQKKKKKNQPLLGTISHKFGSYGYQQGIKMGENKLKNQLPKRCQTHAGMSK